MAEVDRSTKGALVIDDEPFMLTLVSEMLQEIGYKKIKIANNGLDGLIFLRDNASDVDFIILDLEMPKLDGFGTLKSIRQKKFISHNQVPVVILTGHTELSNLFEMVNLGIHGYLVKPVSREKLDEAVSRCFNGEPIDPANFMARI